MKKFRLTILLTALFIGGQTHAQNWQLVWSDEFTSGISSDWVFETGGGGWGNNELEYYLPQNASVQNGQLRITAKHESYGGSNYTSVRMKTQGKKSWTYGKIEASIATPSFQGAWPAFWMLGDNISSLGWPGCGEIDIMEHVNTGGQVNGTVHWKDQNGNQADFGSATTVNNITAFHLYSIEWTTTYIRWFVDGVKYNEIDITNNIGSTEEFHRNFFILLNFAIGGNWPGFSIDNNAFPSTMLVDYVRVYQDAGTSIVGVTNLGGAAYFLQNRYSGLSMDVQAWSTADGGNIEQWSYSGGTNQQFYFTHLGNGVYEITAVNGGKALDVANASIADGANIQQWGYGGGTNQQFIVSSTGDGYYKLISKNSNKLVEVAGFSTVPGGNVQQWSDVGQQTGQWKLTPVTPAFSKTIQAENYSNMAGVQTESTTDAGGGLDVGWIDAGDWMEYNSINFPTSGTYTVQYRVASPNGGKLSMDLNAGSIQLGAVNIPATGGWQNWTTVSQTVNVNAGTYNLGIYAQTGGWNINWFTITKQGSARMAQTSSLTNADEAAFELHPNPVFNELFLNIPAGFIDGSVKIINIQGIEMFNSNTVSDKVDVSNLGAGLYSIVLIKDDKMISKRFIKQ
jgi:beta-glucanase (GH16 family)